MDDLIHTSTGSERPDLVIFFGRAQRVHSSNIQKSRWMRRWDRAIKIVALILPVVFSSCRQTYEPRGTLGMADPAIASQLLTGFYAIENNSWRWVGRNFSVALKPPPSTGAGGHLIVELYFPDDEIQKLGPVTLTAAIDGNTIGSETFQKAGHYAFKRNLSTPVLDTNILPVQFCFDKSLTTVSDRRELAAVVTGIALLPGPAQ